HVAIDDLAGDGERRVLGVVVDVPVRRGPELAVLLGEEPAEEIRRERLAGARSGRSIAVGEARLLVHPLPEDAEADLAGRGVLHEIEDVVVAEEVGRLQRRRLEAAPEGVAVLERDAEEVARAAHGARGRLEEREVERVLLAIAEAREGSAELV